MRLNLRNWLEKMMVLALGATSFTFAQAPGQYSTDAAGKFLKGYCVACHQGKSSAGGLDLSSFSEKSSFQQHPDRWTAVMNRVRNSEMPPKGAKAPSGDEREQFTDWANASLRAEACAAGVTPGPAPIRRLNRAEYRSTIRDLLGIHLDVSANLPGDGAGGEGFDNAAETLFLSPIHAEKYLEAARLALNTALGDAKSREKLLTAKPGKDVSPDAAARKILDGFLPRAFRRPVTDADIEPFLNIFHAARKQKESFENSIGLTLRGVLISPDFLFRSELQNSSSQPRLLNDYALASRLSYFLWGTMPDNLLFDLAADGKLQDPQILEWQIARMLRNPKALDFEERFVEQWLGTRELGKSFTPDLNLFPIYKDEELRSDIRYQPIMFFRELIMNDLSLLNLIDSRFTFATRKLKKLYNIDFPLSKPNTSGMPQRMELPENSDRGGLLGMTAVLAVSSHPHRTSPVLRGKWVLDSLLGTPPPPPPPNVPELKQSEGAAPKTLRELLTQHRANAVCASCHNRIDPIGFALENYDVLGRWRTEDAGKPIDNAGELPDGKKFSGPTELKKVLLDRKDLFIRYLTQKMLGYALGRGLTLSDSCTVDTIVAKLEQKNYSAQTLIREIVFSMPFRYQSGAVTKSAIPETKHVAQAGEKK